MVCPVWTCREDLSAWKHELPVTIWLALLLCYLQPEPVRSIPLVWLVGLHVSHPEVGVFHARWDEKWRMN